MRAPSTLPSSAHHPPITSTAAPGARAPGACLASPPPGTVLRGERTNPSNGKSGWKLRDVGIDWVRVAFSHEGLDEAKRILWGWFGCLDGSDEEIRCRSIPPRFWCEEAVAYGLAKLHHMTEHVMPGGSIIRKPGPAVIEIPGKALALLPEGMQENLIEELDRLPGSLFTRVDVFIDVECDGPDDDLITNVGAWLDEGMLVHKKRVKPHFEYDASTGHHFSRGYTFGARGQNSGGSMVRCYDKGLQTGEAHAGQWVRLEAEVHKPNADWVAAVLVEDRSPRMRRSIIARCIDFREKAPRWVKLNDRKRPDRWHALIEEDPMAFPPQQRQKLPQDAARWCERVGKSACANVQRLADAWGMSIAELVRRLAGHHTGNDALVYVAARTGPPDWVQRRAPLPF